MSDQIVLFDIPTRLLLNFKGLDYKTEWLEYPEIKPALEAHVPANPSTGTWTIPTLKFPDGTYLMDSRQIVNKIEQSHPEPSIHLDSPILPKLEAIMPRLMGSLRPIYFLTVPGVLLSEKNFEYWHETRSKTAGMPLSQLSAEHGGQRAWDAAKPILHEVEVLLRENQEGPFFLGKTISYADFVWTGFLLFIQRNGVIEELYKVSSDSQLHKGLLEATAPWYKRNDH